MPPDARVLFDGGPAPLVAKANVVNDAIVVTGVLGDEGTGREEWLRIVSYGQLDRPTTFASGASRVPAAPTTTMSDAARSMSRPPRRPPVKPPPRDVQRSEVTVAVDLGSSEGRPRNPSGREFGKFEA